MRPLVPRQPKAILIGPSSPRLGSPRFISTRTLASQFLLQPKHRLQLTRARARTMSTATNPPIPTILSSAAPPSIEPQFSQGTCDDPAELRAALAPLLVENGGRWTLMANGEGLEREFRFKTFARTWDFMTAVSLQCKLKSHHPEWSNVYNTTFIRWTTHHPKGLSAKDIEMAALCDKLAQEFGEILPADSTTSSTAKTTTTESKPPSAASASTAGADIPSCALSGLANRAAGSAGECCVPKHLQK